MIIEQEECESLNDCKFRVSELPHCAAVKEHIRLDLIETIFSITEFEY